MRRIIDFLDKFHAERWLWCIVVAAFCWTDISDYHHMVNNKKLCVWIVLGLYYVIKQGVLKRENRRLSVVCMVLGGIVSAFFIKTNYFANYIYYNYTLGLLSVVLFLQYGLVIKRIVKKRRMPSMSMPGILLLLMTLYTQLSPLLDKSSYLMLFVMLLPYACMELDGQRRKQIFTGMVDGLCLGFIICQVYTFMYRPYFITSNGSRFKSYRDYCTAAGVSYLQFYIGCLFRYAIWFQDNSKKWIRKLFFVLAAFALSFIYMTGGRMPFVGALIVTACVFAWIYNIFSKKNKLVLWGWKCAWMLILSLALFPVAYTGTRYLPTIINKPDLQDSEGNRTNSFATVHLKQKFLYNEEWGYWAIMEGDPKDSVKYITYEECVCDTLCRVVPFIKEICFPTISKDAFDDKVARIEYLFENEDITDLGFCESLLIYCDMYGQPIPAQYKALIEEKQALSELRNNVFKEFPTDSKEETKNNLSLLIRAHAFGGKLSERQAKEWVPGRGDTKDTAWFESETSYTAMELRLAIHQYTWKKLNLLGHERKSFEMYYVKGEEYYIGNPHNIFLMMGYDYGVPAMLLMISVFGVLLWKSWKASKKNGKVEYLLPAMLVLGFSIYGWFETGFGASNSYTILILLSAVLWRNNKIVKKRK